METSPSCPDKEPKGRSNSLSIEPEGVRNWDRGLSNAKLPGYPCNCSPNSFNSFNALQCTSENILTCVVENPKLWFMINERAAATP